jgi:hypothetical protein
MTSNIWCAEPASASIGLACLERHAGIRESGDQRGIDRLCKDRRVAAVWEVDYRAVLGNDSVYKAQLAGYPTKFGKSPAGDKHHLDAPSAGTSDGFKHRRIRPIVARDRAVVIQSQKAEFHVRNDFYRVAITGVAMMSGVALCRTKLQMPRHDTVRDSSRRRPNTATGNSK